MKIAMIGHKYVPSREGGIEVVVKQLATRMAKAGHDVTLFNRKRKEYPLIHEYEGCKVENIFTINKKALDAIVYSYFATKKAKKMAKKGQFDVLHFHAEGPCFFLNKLPKKRNYKVVVTIHGLDWERGKWGGFASKVIKKGEENAVKYADEIIVLSKNVQQYFKNTYNRETTFIPNGVNYHIPHDPEIIKQKYGLEKNSYVLFVARIVPEKGLHYLIEAWKRLTPEEKKGRKLVIAGSASHSSDYYASIQEMTKGDDSILMIGFVQGRELHELYANALLYVLPSDLEGMPMSLLEAESFGANCLTSDIEECKSVITTGDITFQKGNVDDLYKKLKEYLLSDSHFIKEAYIPYSWDKVVEETLKVYQK